uniref:Uncharacterized protein n=1 Tax=Meloidogyne hapla TaxID=6305 RepID=A0A1I8B8H1_MELHA
MTRPPSLTIINRERSKNYHNKFSTDLAAIKEVNGCNNKNERVINPTEQSQKKLINYYIGKNKTFGDTRQKFFDKKGRSNRTRILNRLDNLEQKIEYVRGLAALYKFGEVSTTRFNEVGKKFVNVVLAICGIPLYCQYKRTKHADGGDLKIMEKEIDKFIECIHFDKKECKRLM